MLVLNQVPTTGQRKKRRAFDFQQVQTVSKKGRRTEDLGQGEPLCKEEFIRWYTSDDCPPYRRALTKNQSRNVMHW